MQHSLQTNDFHPGDAARGWRCTLAVCGTLTIIAAVSGLIISTVALSSGLGHEAPISRAGFWLLLVAFPLAALTAHSLDKLDAARRAAVRHNA